MNRKLVYMIATSQDGFVAREDDAVDDFSFEGEHVADLLKSYPETLPTHIQQHLGLNSSNKKFDTVLMGRATYDVGRGQGILSPYQHLRQFVFSRSMKESGIKEMMSQDVQVVTEKALRFVRELKSQAGMDIWLCGGPKLATELVDEIDSIILKVNPFLMGAGKSLFVSSFPKKALNLSSCKTYSNGFQLLEFDIQRS